MRALSLAISKGSSHNFHMRHVDVASLRDGFVSFATHNRARFGFGNRSYLEAEDLGLDELEGATVDLDEALASL